MTDTPQVTGFCHNCEAAQKEIAKLKAERRKLNNTVKSLRSRLKEAVTFT
jgi:cell division protein FtsB